jgi:hypothetical protein
MAKPRCIVRSQIPWKARESKGKRIQGREESWLFSSKIQPKPDVSRHKFQSRLFHHIISKQLKIRLYINEKNIVTIYTITSIKDGSQVESNDSNNSIKIHTKIPRCTTTHADQHSQITFELPSTQVENCKIVLSQGQ